jgi:GH15 family glucan-1,4-alpha-glucosidase
MAVTSRERSDGAPPQAEPSGPESAAAPSPFPPIADYAFLSDCHTGALVAPDGTVDWLCVPRFDAPSVFGSLIDRQAGGFRLGPFGATVPAGRRYEPGTNVLVTTWHTPGGWVETRDALTLGPRRGTDTVTPHTRPPADDDADHTLVRLVSCFEGAVEIELLCEPVFDYGRAPAEWATDEAGHVADASAAGVTIRLTTSMALGAERGRVRARHILRTGERLFCSLSWAAELASPGTLDEAEGRLASTARFWRSWLDRARPVDHRWRVPIERSALAIKGLTFMPTGATVAALTTSLPETPGGERNWDYRYAWMRDSTFTLRALH